MGMRATRRSTQDALQWKLGNLAPDEWYTAETAGERVALGFMYKRGEVVRQDGRYRFPPDESAQLEIGGSWGAAVVPLRRAS